MYLESLSTANIEDKFKQKETSKTVIYIIRVIKQNQWLKCGNKTNWRQIKLITAITCTI